MDTKNIGKIILISSVSTLFVAIVIVGGGFFVYTNYPQGWVADFKTERQSNAVIKKAGKVVRLSEGEKPQVSVVLDAQALKQNDSFFESAQNGNAVLIYEQSGTIILFDSTRNKVLNMGMVATSSTQ